MSDIDSDKIEIFKQALEDSGISSHYSFDRDKTNKFEESCGEYHVKHSVGRDMSITGNIFSGGTHYILRRYLAEYSDSVNWLVLGEGYLNEYDDSDYLETEDRVKIFLSSDDCVNLVELIPTIYKSTGMNKSKLFSFAYSFEFRGELLYLVSMPRSLIDVSGGYVDEIFVGGVNLSKLHEFQNLLYSYERDLSDKVYCYEHGSFNEDIKLKDNLVSWDDVILDSSLKDELRSETEAFISGVQGDIYNRLGLPHRRGFIFIGEPGCGKTLTARVLACENRIPFLYVKNKGNATISGLYNSAMGFGKCILLLEDLDSLIGGGNDLSTFLNTLDGLSTNSEILCIATTNHPERIDPALLARPSRFDRKFYFDMPGVELRREYIDKKLLKLYPDLDLDINSSILDTLYNKTNEYSFALLQELIIQGAFNYESGKFTNIFDSLLFSLDNLKNQLKLSDPGRIVSKKSKKAGFRSNED